MDERSLAFARELEHRDAALADAIEGVAELQRQAEDVRAAAGRASDVLASLPRERDAARTALGRAREDVERRREELTGAERQAAEAERAGRPERIETARRALERARDALSLAERRVERAEGELRALDRREEDAEREAGAVDERAQALAVRVAAAPRVARESLERPAGGLEGAVAWASRARAALWVVRSGLESERERVVREANELGASVLGEPLAATSVAGVRERLERAAT